MKTNLATPGSEDGDGRKALIKLLGLRAAKVEIDRYSYSPDYPDEVKAWKFIGKRDPDLRRYHSILYYPPAALITLLDLATELLFRLKFEGSGTIPVLVSNEARFRKPVVPENELLVQVKLLRNYRGRIGIFAGVVANREGDIVAENISRGTIINLTGSSP